MSEWKPIETAPRDGTPFLCFHPDPEFSPRTGIDLIWYEPSIKTYTQDGDNEVPFSGITHWMPLPAPPSRGVKLSEWQRRLDASVNEEQAREYVHKERERNANHDKPYPAPRDGFINDYD